MNINGSSHAVVAKGFADHGSNGQVGDIVVVHDVEMNNIGTCFQDIVNFFSQFCEVGRKDRGSNEVVLVAPNIKRSGTANGLLLSKKNGCQINER